MLCLFYHIYIDKAFQINLSSTQLRYFLNILCFKILYDFHILLNISLHLWLFFFSVILSVIIIRIWLFLLPSIHTSNAMSFDSKFFNTYLNYVFPLLDITTILRKFEELNSSYRFYIMFVRCVIYLYYLFLIFL